MLRFAKMNGTGNSILVLDARGDVPAITGEIARELCRGDLAFDQMMVLRDPPHRGFDAAVSIFNTDGSPAGACGNGSRCVAWFMAETGSGDTLTLDVDGNTVTCRRDGPLDFTLDMGHPRLDWRDIPLADNVDTLAVELGTILDETGLEAPVAVSMGNPHAVFIVPDAAAVALAEFGPLFEHNPMFPDRANISFAQVVSPDRIVLRVWERGAGATLACGTAACAALVATARRRLTGRQARVTLPGGDLEIAWRDDDHVMLSGAVALEHRGRLDPITGTVAPW